MKKSDFCIFILTHGRPDKVVTCDSLKKSGYTGKVFIVIDDEDETEPEYRKRFGDKVLKFSKKEVAKTFDEADNFSDRRSITYARNVCFDLAKKLGYTYFMELDDDYMQFSYTYYILSKKFKWQIIKNLDHMIKILLSFHKSSPFHSIALAQGGDFIGGSDGIYSGQRRKAMNTFICSTKRPFKFIGRMNEDVNTYTSLGRRGFLFLTIPQLRVTQLQTQSNAGGMSEFYILNGTYKKSFYSVMHSPSCVKIMMMNTTNSRLHHAVSWKNAVPKIISEKYKKKISKR